MKNNIFFILLTCFIVQLVAILGISNPLEYSVEYAISYLIGTLVVISVLLVAKSLITKANASLDRELNELKGGFL